MILKCRAFNDANIPTSAITSMVAVSGPLTFKEIDTHGDSVQVELSTVIDLSELTLTVNCSINDESITDDSCIVVVRSTDNPEKLMVKVQSREFTNPLVYDVEAETN